MVAARNIHPNLIFAPKVFILPATGSAGLARDRVYLSLFGFAGTGAVDWPVTKYLL